MLQGTGGNKHLTFRLPNKRPLLERDLFISSIYSFRPMPNKRRPVTPNCNRLFK